MLHGPPRSCEVGDAEAGIGGCGNGVDKRRSLTERSHCTIPRVGVDSAAAPTGATAGGSRGEIRESLRRTFPLGKACRLQPGECMDQKIEPERNWGVSCLHCGKPFPVPFEPSESSESETSETNRTSRRLFLAWCPSCNREAPYSVADMVRLQGRHAVSSAASEAAATVKTAAGAS